MHYGVYGKIAEVTYFGVCVNRIFFSLRMIVVFCNISIYFYQLNLK